ncbi:MAG: GTP-binding protein [Clostridia bacterium]|nr:GTP-binding protein [Clostridia bacterium]MBR7175385.1 GTP-binding protein [Clostridia bacterium]
MTKIDVFSGFLGAGKTTLIKKLLKDAYTNQKVVLIENEFGEIGIDGGFMKEAGIQVTEMNSGCICCSLVGDFGEALKKVLETYHPDRILIEPSGVGKLSDVVRAASAVCGENCQIGALVAVVDASKAKIYIKNFGEFFINQIEHAATIILSRTDIASAQKIDDCVKLIREHNQNATVITTPVGQLDGMQILKAMEKADTLEQEMAQILAEVEDDDDECDDPECECHHHHHHDDDEHEHEHEHHHHEHDDDEDEHEHEHHHHDHDHEHEHHEHHHDHGHGHHHHHDADEVFTSWGVETPKRFTEAGMKEILSQLQNEADYGMILRSKGIVQAENGEWIHFDYTPGETDVRHGGAEVTGRLCVIGSKINEENLKKLFGV